MPYRASRIKMMADRAGGPPLILAGQLLCAALRSAWPVKGRLEGQLELFSWGRLNDCPPCGLFVSQLPPSASRVCMSGDLSASRQRR